MTDVVEKIIIKGRKRSILALLLSISTIIGVFYICYVADHIVHNAQMRFELLEANDRNNQLNIDSKFSDLNQKIMVTNNKLSLLNANSFTVINHELNELISSANQSLIIYNDIPATLKFLNYAQDILLNNNNPSYTQLKVALVSDISKLKAANSVDIAVIATQLNSIIANIDGLDLIIRNDILPQNIASNSAGNSKWQMFVSNFKNTLLGLVQVSRVSDHDGLRLLPNQEVIVKQNLKLDLLNARMALILHDKTSWSSSLHDADQIIVNYFVLNAQSLNIVNEIDSLRSKNITSVGTDINNTLRAINQLNSLN